VIGHHIRAAVKSLWREKWINVLCMLSIATGLFLMAVAALGIYNIERATSKLPERFSLTVYLKDGLTTDDVQYIMKEIKKSPAVKTVDYTSKDDALKDLRATMRDSEYILAGLNENPLPASMAVGLNRASVTDLTVGKLAGKIEALKGVAEVEYGKKLLRVIESVKKNSELLGGFLISALAAAIIFVCYSTVKILFYRRMQEVETLKLLGATRWFIRMPFLIEGGLIGLGGGLISAVGVAAVVYAGYRKIEATLPLIGALSTPPEFLYWLLATGFCLGIMGSLIAIGRIKF
jgi:cell division transport system permease protein